LKAKPKRQKQEDKKIHKFRLTTPEDVFFGLLVTISVAFAFLCYRGVEQIPTVSFASLKMKAATPLQKNIRKLVNGYPMEAMVPYLGKRDQRVAAYLVAIAKKESNWGRYSPKKDGQECYNFWGYRGQENPTASGYSCFQSPAQAVSIVGQRVKKLLAKKIDTPRKMVLWKCGASCTRGEARSAAKWIRDVSLYYNKLYPTPPKLNQTAFLAGQKI